jgi:hypothetical protein
MIGPWRVMGMLAVESRIAILELYYQTKLKLQSPTHWSHDRVYADAVSDVVRSGPPVHPRMRVAGVGNEG